MIHAFLYLLIGSAVSYFMQPQIRYLAAYITNVSWLQTVAKIFMDALLGLTWVVSCPLMLILNRQLKQKEKGHEE